MRLTRRTLTTLWLPVAVLATSGCFAPGEGVEPPLDRLYFPVNLASDENADHLFIANSNFDLQFNGGTVQSFDLKRLRELVPKSCASDGDCPGLRCDLEPNAENGGFPSGWCVATDGPFAGQPCGPFGEKSAADKLLAPGRCGAVNPSVPQDGGPSLVVDSVGIGAFATDLIYRKAPDDAVAAPHGRLFLPVRGDTTLHWIDVDDAGGLECGQDGNDGDCDDEHRRGDDPAEESTRNLRLDPEPFGLDATEDGRAVVMTHQVGGRVSLFVNDWGPRGPMLEFILPGLPERPIGIAAIPEPKFVTLQDIRYDPGFLVTFRDAAEVRLVRFADDAVASPARPFLASAGAVNISANSVGFDSRGIALDSLERRACEADCGEDIQCLQVCTGVPLRTYVANRTPSSLLVGLSRTNQSATSSDDLPLFNDSDPMPFGPSRVTVGQVIDRKGQPQTRVFLVCFDSRVVVPFNPESGEAEEAFVTGRGPHAFHVDFSAAEGRALGYVAHFTDSYIGVIDLDQRNPTYGQIVLTVGVPTAPRASEMNGRVSAIASCCLLLAGCTETPVSAPLRSLEGSGEVAFVCVGPNGEGRSIDDCPDYERQGASHLHALVTQEKGEVAVIDLHQGSVVDVDPSTPGFSFLPIGADPRNIVSTPGGVATFVGVAEVGREGIFGLPSTCIVAPHVGDAARDLTTWPACSLPSAPGAMVVLIDRPDSEGRRRDRCPNTVPGTNTDGAATQDNECPADLTTEPGPVGRRKLAVALPELGRIDVFDAQAILNREPGSFQPCDLDLEAQIPLRVDLPDVDVPQRVPQDLQKAGCVAPVLNHGPRTNRFEASPAGFALGGDTLYVGDRKAPVIHALDVADPCAITERPTPLLPVSYEDPRRIVTTTEVALSEPTTLLQRFLYAIDWNEGSVMVFDVTPGATDRTPLVRPGAARVPFEPADRIRFASPPTALSFAHRDLPIVDANGVATTPYCNPDPAVQPPDPGARYRPTLDRSLGAAPANLRGTFGLVALKNGSIAVIDVEDYDAACRRPVATNPTTVEDFRGCKNDPTADPFTTDGVPTVSDEVSCRVVQPHHARSATFMQTSDDNGVRAPSLRTLPRFSTPGEPNPDRNVFPKMLAVDRTPETPAEVYVGTELRTTSTGEEKALDIDPESAEEHSLILPWVEPRSYPPSDELDVTFEGIFSQRTGATGSIRGNRFLDQFNGNFCQSGVQDLPLVREWGTELGLTRSQDLDLFEREHADYVQVTGAVLAQDETYWQSPVGAACAEGRGYLGCVDEFGPPTGDTLDPNRDLVVLEAYQNELLVAPRYTDDPAEQQRILDNMQCCFPANVSYNIRGGKQWIVTGSSSGFRHNISAEQEENGNRFRCVRDCRPRVALQKARAVEIPWQGCTPSGDAPCPACSLQPTVDRKVNPDPRQDPRAACIFESINMRFVIYEGVMEIDGAPAASPSERDMAFAWVTSGGFAPLVATLTSQTFSVSPVSMQFVPQIGQLAVVDGSAAGLVFVSLDSLGVSRLFF